MVGTRLLCGAQWQKGETNAAFCLLRGGPERFLKKMNAGPCACCHSWDAIFMARNADLFHGLAAREPEGGLGMSGYWV